MPLQVTVRATVRCLYDLSIVPFKLSVQWSRTASRSGKDQTVGLIGNPRVFSSYHRCPHLQTVAEEFARRPTRRKCDRLKSCPKDPGPRFKDASPLGFGIDTTPASLACGWVQKIDCRPPRIVYHRHRQFVDSYVMHLLTDLAEDDRNPLPTV